MGEVAAAKPLTKGVNCRPLSLASLDSSPTRGEPPASAQYTISHPPPAAVSGYTCPAESSQGTREYPSSQMPV